MRTLKLSPRNQYLLLVCFGVGILLVALFGLFQTFGVNPLSFFNRPQTNVTSGKLFTGTVQDLIGRGGNYSCTWNESQKNIRSTGIVYVSEKNLAANAQVIISGFTVTANVIGDGKKFYVWTSIPGSKGMSLNYSELEKTAAKASPQTELLKQKLNFMCSPWTPDSSKFTLPTNITF